MRRVSPESTYVARGQPLKLSVTLNGTYVDLSYFDVSWRFRRFLSQSFNALLRLTWYHYRITYRPVDTRASVVDNVSLLLSNTTLNDSGTYWCSVTSWSWSGRFRQINLYFNVTIEGR